MNIFIRDFGYLCKNIFMITFLWKFLLTKIFIKHKQSYMKLAAKKIFESSTNSLRNILWMRRLTQFISWTCLIGFQLPSHKYNNRTDEQVKFEALYIYIYILLQHWANYTITSHVLNTIWHSMKKMCRSCRSAIPSEPSSRTCRSTLRQKSCQPHQPLQPQPPRSNDLWLPLAPCPKDWRPEWSCLQMLKRFWSSCANDFSETNPSTWRSNSSKTKTTPAKSSRNTAWNLSTRVCRQWLSIKMTI